MWFPGYLDNDSSYPSDYYYTRQGISQSVSRRPKKRLFTFFSCNFLNIRCFVTFSKGEKVVILVLFFKKSADSRGFSRVPHMEKIIVFSFIFKFLLIFRIFWWWFLEKLQVFEIFGTYLFTRKLFQGLVTGYGYAWRLWPGDDCLEITAG